jgi:hypothetical protein
MCQPKQLCLLEWWKPSFGYTMWTENTMIWARICSHVCRPIFLWYCYTCKLSWSVAKQRVAWTDKWSTHTTCNRMVLQCIMDVIFCKFLNTMFPVWIGYCGTITWPPRSPDFMITPYGASQKMLYMLRNQEMWSTWRQWST